MLAARLSVAGAALSRLTGTLHISRALTTSEIARASGVVYNRVFELCCLQLLFFLHRWMLQEKVMCVLQGKSCICTGKYALYNLSVIVLIIAPLLITILVLILEQGKVP